MYQAAVILLCSRRPVFSGRDYYSCYKKTLVCHAGINLLGAMILLCTVLGRFFSVRGDLCLPGWGYFTRCGETLGHQAGFMAVATTILLFVGTG